MIIRKIFILMACVLMVNTSAQTQVRVVKSQADSAVGLLAEAAGLKPVTADQIPRHGTFWLVMNEGSFLMPMPFLPNDSKTASVFSLGVDGQFLVDTTGGLLPQPTKRQISRGTTSATLLKEQTKAVLDLIAQVQDEASLSSVKAASKMMEASGAGESPGMNFPQFWGIPGL